VATLVKRWSVKAGSSVSDEPIVAGGVVYWGSWDGFEHATTIFGKRLWSAYVGRTVTGQQCNPSAVGVAGTAAFAWITIHKTARSVVFVPGEDAQLYALNALTGARIWHAQLGQLDSAFLWDSPLVYRGNVYIGVSSFGDCPLVQGRLFKLNVTTGAIESTFNAVPNGCTGVGIWASPAFDAAAGTIYLATGNDGGCSSPEPLSEAIVEIRASNLHLMSSWSVPIGARNADSDFGATPILFSVSASHGHATEMVGAVNKNGIFYAFKAGHLRSGPVWEEQISNGGQGPQYGHGDIAPAAWDGRFVYVVGGQTTVNGESCGGSVSALNPATGRPVWQDCLTNFVLGAPAVVPGVVIIASGDAIMAIDAGSGQILSTIGFTGAEFWGSPSISTGTIYVGDMNNRLLAVSPKGIF
jgi:polyvinyl alcohol dehydrogenase (cytochrome)